jgi:DNA-binding MarR family transcriptional regulator
MNMEMNKDLLNILGLLADEDKFKVTRATALGAGTPGDIGKATGLDSSKIIKTLVRLEKAGLIENRGDDGYYYCAKVTDV